MGAESAAPRPLIWAIQKRIKAPSSQKPVHISPARRIATSTHFVSSCPAGALAPAYSLAKS